MKPKNMAFMGVALAFGLLAAFVTSKMYQTQANTEERMSVLVAKQNIPVGTLIDDKNIDAMLTRTDMPKDVVPQDALLNPEQLKGKKLVAMKQAKAWFTPADISLAPDVVCPPGYKRFAIKTSLAQAVSGFVSPGSHVDIWGMLEDLKESRIKSPARIMRNALVLSVDSVERRESVGAVQAVSTMTIAVKDSDAVMLKLFENNGVSLVLLDDRQEYNSDLNPLFDIDVTKLPGWPKKKEDEPKPEVAPAVKFEKVLIAKKTLKQNDKVTLENLDDYFAEIDIAVGGDGKLPADAVTNRSEMRNKFLTVDLLAGSWVMKTALSDTAVAAAPATVIAPVAPARERHKMLIYSGSRQVEVVYEKTDTGWKIVEGAEAAEQPKSREKKDEKEAPKAQPNAAGPGERVTINN